jgi:hypothetical protein
LAGHAEPVESSDRPAQPDISDDPLAHGNRAHDAADSLVPTRCLIVIHISYQETPWPPRQ